MSGHNLFETLWHWSKDIDFDSAWENGTGYFDNIVSAAIPGMRRFKDNHGRRAVVVPLPDLIIVMNERFSGQDIVVVNRYPRMRNL